METVLIVFPPITGVNLSHSVLVALLANTTTPIKDNVFATQTCPIKIQTEIVSLAIHLMSGTQIL